MADKTVKLLSAGKISLLITKAISAASAALSLIHEAAVQCMLHAEKHGDVTLAQRLVQEVKDNCPGIVVAGLNEWYREYSPINLTMENGQVKAKLLKEGEKGYKAFNSAEAAEKKALNTAEVKSRAERPITKPTIAFFKQRIQGFAKQVERYQENAPEDQKMSEAEVATVKTWLLSISEFGNRVSLISEAPSADNVADAKGGNRKTVIKAKRARRAKENMPAPQQAVA